MVECQYHIWVAGGLDWVCDDCGLRANMPEDELQKKESSEDS